LMTEMNEKIMFVGPGDYLTNTIIGS